MASDGKIQEQESSQLQQVIGGNDGLLAHALAYVKAFPVEKFLEDAPSVLSQRDKLCIMANVCDSMLADGNADKRELEIFETFREAFDLQKSDINHIIDTVTLKNNKNIFGEFELITSDKLSDITPHLAMAVSIVYMMSADGTIGQEEIGQLETMIGEFEGLQQYALQFVRKVKRSDFLNQAKHALDKQQRLCVLLNVCDSMMSDESVGMLEDKLFVSMLDAFSVKESAFKKYYEVLELKNIKPFDVSDFEYSIEHVRALSKQEQKGIVVEGLDDQSEVGDGIQRTMDSNTEKVTNDFGSSDDIHKVQENATHELEKQRFLEIKVDPNLQKALGGSDADKNIQVVNGSSSSAILKTSPLDDRVENLQKVVDELSQKLNKFETKNKSLLNNVRASTNKESSREPAFENQESKANKAKVANAAVKDNLQSLASQQADETNKTTVAKEAIKDNKQAIASSQTLVNKATVAKEAIKDNNLVVASVLSGNRNFEGRIHSLVKANYLASPALVVAYCLAGSIKINLDQDPIGIDKNGNKVYLKDIWPLKSEIDAVINQHVNRAIFSAKWDLNSTYIRLPNYFDNLHNDNAKAIKNAKILAIFGDSITTDHISPAGNIASNSPASSYLSERKVEKKDFNSYGARRGNHEVMIRGTFANVRIKNEMLGGLKEGGFTKNINNEITSIYDSAISYQDKNSLVIFAGKEYGTGSSRDWAAKGTFLLGVKAVIAESFERIHRSNLIGMGVLPLIFKENQNRKTLNLNGDEIVEVLGIDSNIKPRQDLKCIIHKKDGSKIELNLTCGLDTGNEVEYFKCGGILQFVINQIIN